MTLNRRSIALIAGAAVALLTVALASTAAAVPDPAPVVTTGQPEYDYDDPSKSFLIDLNFGSTSATALDVSVGEQRSDSHVGDPPLLRLSLTDEDGSPAGTFNAWDPRWSFDEKSSGGERLIVRNGPGTLTLPFDADAGSLLVRDLRAGIDLVTVDLRPAVHEFCLAHPSDPDCVEADLAVTATTAPSDPLGIIGQPFTLRVQAVIANLGPDGPVDVDVAQTVTWSSGLTVTPGSRTFDVDGLAVGSPTTVNGDYQVTCTQLGDHPMTVTTSVTPEKAKVADLDATNDVKSVTLSIACAIPVTVNVVPGSLVNPVAVDPGVLAVAVLTTAAGEYGAPQAFYAVTIQPATVRIGVRDALVTTGTGAPELHGRVHLEDSWELDELTRDGDRDGILHGRRNQLGIQPGTIEVCVRGRFGPGAGTAFFGCDHITLVP